MNTTDKDVAIETFKLPARSLSMYPSVEGGAVGWRSPVTGTVKITGCLTDSDPYDGAGVVWVIDHGSQAFRRELSTGTLPNGGRRTLEQGRSPGALERVDVKAGDEIDLQIWLNRSDAHYDMLFGRLPTEGELALACAFIESSPQDGAAEGAAGKSPDLDLWEEYVQALFLTNEYLYLD